jgi:hypothetical protein
MSNFFRKMGLLVMVASAERSGRGRLSLIRWIFSSFVAEVCQFIGRVVGYLAYIGPATFGCARLLEMDRSDLDVCFPPGMSADQVRLSLGVPDKDFWCDEGRVICYSASRCWLVDAGFYVGHNVCTRELRFFFSECSKLTRKEVWGGLSGCFLYSPSCPVEQFPA